MNGLLVLAVLTPLLLAPFVIRPYWRWLLWIAPVPAFGALWLVPDTALKLPWLLFGTALVLDATNTPFLLLTIAVWSAAALTLISAPAAATEGARFRFLFLVAFSANLWLILAAEPLGFYLGFAAMGLATYGLILEPGGQRQQRAARLYLAMTLVAELAIFAALVLMATPQDLGWRFPLPPQTDGTTIALLLLGLGIKGGLMPLHLWLPLTYATAPLAVAAALSGAMSKAALLGWLRLLPLGQTPLPDWGLLFIGLGLTSLLLALGIGLSQANPRRILAYSSISTSGLFVLVLGLMLLKPELVPIGTPALALYAVHHALVFAGLFLGLGLRKQGPSHPRLDLGLILLAAALAGVPFTSGALVKSLLKPLLNAVDWVWLDLALAIAAVGAALLMVRFIWLIAPLSVRPIQTPQDKPCSTLSFFGLGAWFLLVGTVIILPFVLGGPTDWLSNGLPPLIAFLLAAPVLLAASRQAPGSRSRPGSNRDAWDWLEPLILIYLRAGQWLLTAWSAWVERLCRPLANFPFLFNASPVASVGDAAGMTHAWLRNGALWLAMVACLLALLLLT